MEHNQLIFIGEDGKIQPLHNPNPFIELTGADGDKVLVNKNLISRIVEVTNVNGRFLRTDIHFTDGYIMVEDTIEDIKNKILSNS